MVILLVRKDNYCGREVFTIFKELSQEEQSKVIEETGRKSTIHRKKDLTDVCYKILADLTSSKGAGLRTYSRIIGVVFNKYLSVSIKNVQESLEVITIMDEIKMLYARNFISLNFSSESYEEFKDTILGESDKRSIATMILLLNDKTSEYTTIALTEKGATELLGYNLQKSEELIQKTEENHEQSTKDIRKLEEAIQKFHENIFTIFSLMLAVFAIIGLNVAAIPKISDHFIRNVIMINLTICLSLCIVFTLVSAMLYKEKNSIIWKLLVLVTIIFLISIIVLVFV